MLAVDTQKKKKKQFTVWAKLALQLTLMSVLNDDWYKVGEGDAYFMKEIFKYPEQGVHGYRNITLKLKH